MATSEVTAQRRRDISAFVADHPTIGFDKATAIARALGINVREVNNDVKFLREKLKVDYSQYGLGGLRDKAKVQVDRLSQLQEAVKIILNNSDDNDVKLKAIHTEMDLIHNIYQLEHEGIGVINQEIKAQEKEEEEGKENEMGHYSN